MNDTKTNIIKVVGKNIDSFFQNIITNDIRNLTISSSLYTALLSPQGKYLHDFIMIKKKDYFLLENNENKTVALINDLKKYDIRNEIQIQVEKNLISKVVLKNKLYKSFDQKITTKKIYREDNYLFFLDPRSENFLFRFWIDKRFVDFLKLNSTSQEEIEKNRILMKIPNSDVDLTYNKSFILNYNFENINAISFDKGCYIGQENTARQKYRGKQKYSLKALKIIKGPSPKLNDEIFYQNKKIGVMKSKCNNFCLSLIRVEESIKLTKEIKTDQGTLLKIL